MADVSGRGTVDIESPQNPALHARISEQLRRLWIHDLLVVPETFDFSRYPLGGLNAHSKCFSGIRQVALIQNAKQKDRCVLLAHVSLSTWLNACRYQEGQSWNAADLLPMEVVDLNKRLRIPKRINLADVTVLLDDRRQQVGRGGEFGGEGGGGLFADRRNDTGHERSFPSWKYGHNVRGMDILRRSEVYRKSKVESVPVHPRD